MSGFSGIPADIRAINSVGASFGMVAANGAAQTLLAAASNVNGAILRWASAQCVSAVSAIYVGTAAPSGVSDATKRRLLIAWAGSTFFHTQSGLYLPAGIGIFAVANSSDGSSISGAGWDVL